MQPEEIPGGHQTAAEAQRALVESVQILGVAADTKERLEIALADIKRVIDKLAQRKKDALAAIEVFASIAPGQLAPPRPDIDRNIADVHATTSALVQEVEDILQAVDF